jgi:hypothetical protein
MSLLSTTVSLSLALIQNLLEGKIMEQLPHIVTNAASNRRLQREKIQKRLDDQGKP